MIRVGVCGLGMMGLTHLEVYSKRSDVKVVALADRNPDRLAGANRKPGNIEGQAQGSVDFQSARAFADAMDLLRDDKVDLVDICLPTVEHFAVAKAALDAGKQVLIEKPLARTAADAFKLAELADRSKGLSMCGLCMRFWPGWTWLKEAVSNRTFGAVKSASFRRLSSHPGGSIYSSGALSGGAILDLHIHDTDFVQYCFGPPRAVLSRGYSKITDAIDHVITQFLYDDIPLVTAEGGWCMAQGFGFTMQYTVNFEQATAVFDLASQPPLNLFRDGRSEAVEIPGGMGYEYEIAYFIECIRTNRKPQIVTLESAVRSVKIVEAEVESVRSDKPVSL